MVNICCLNSISEKGINQLPKNYKLVDNLASANGLLLRSADLHKVEFPKNLLAIARAGAGVNNIPLVRCAENGIVVFNTPGANANAVKELVVCGMLLASRGIIDGAVWCRENSDNREIAESAERVKKTFAGSEILGKKLGVVGLGAIGALVANTAISLGMDVFGYDPFLSVDAAWRVSKDVHQTLSLDEIYRECDFITVHVPAMESTKGMIASQEIGLMKNGAVLLNFSRDTLVDNDALVTALNTDKLGCYVTDFAVPEVMKAKNTVVLPHLGASTVEAEDNCADMACQQIVDFIDNGNIKNSVNLPTCDLGPLDANGFRIAIIHRSTFNVIDDVVKLIATTGCNTTEMISNTRNDYAYTLIGCEGQINEDTHERLHFLDGIIRVRIIKRTL